MRFTTQVPLGSGEVELEYRVVVSITGFTLTLRAIPSGGWRVVRWSNGYRAGSYVHDLAPVEIAPGVPERARDDELDVTGDRGFVVELALPCRGETVALRAAWRFALREWGIKELFLESLALTPRPGGEVERELVRMQVPREGGRFVLENELWLEHEVAGESAGDRFALTLTGLAIRRLRRLRRDPAFVLQMRQFGVAEGLELAPYQMTFAEPLDASPDALKRLLEESRDPFVAGQAAYLAGEHRLAALAPVLRACAGDPDEDATVRTNCLWALVRIGGEAPPTWLASLVERVPSARRAALAAWSQLDRGLLAAWFAGEGAAIPEAVALFDAYPSLRAPVRTVITAREVVEVGPHPRDLKVVAGEALVAGSGAIYIRRDGRFTELAQISGLENIAASGDAAIVAAAARGALYIFENGGAKLRHRIPVGGHGTSVAVSPDGAYVATGFGAVVVWDAHSGARVRKLSSKHGPVAWSRSGLHALAGDRLLRWAEPLGGVPVTLVDHAADRFALSPTDANVVVVSGDQTVELWQDGARLDLEPVHDAIVLALAFDASGGRFASGDKAGTIALWTLGSPEPQRVFRVRDARIFGVAFDRDRLLSISIDETVLSSWPLSG